MSKPFAFDPEIACKYGVDEAILIRSFQFWIDLNKTQGRNSRDGRTWVYNTYEEIAEQYPFWNLGKIRRILDSLVSQKVLIKTNKYNKWNIDKTNWYAFENEAEWVTVKFVENQRLPDSTDEESLFGDDDKKSVQNAEGLQNEDNSRLPDSTDGKVSTPNLCDSATAENNRRLPKTTDDCRNQQSETVENDRLDLSKTTDQYQLLTSSLPDADEKKESPVINVYDLLIGKTAFQAFKEGTAEKLEFDFNNIDLVNEKVTQLFRIYIRDIQPHDLHIAQIRKELLDDIRLELSRKVCWVIIQLAFMEYPGTEKKYQNFNSLLRKIGWKKTDFVEDYYKDKKSKEAAVDRMKEKEGEENERNDQLNKMLVWIKTNLEKYRSTLRAAEIAEIKNLIKQNKVMSAKGQLEYYLFDVYKIDETETAA